MSGRGAFASRRFRHRCWGLLGPGLLAAPFVALLVGTRAEVVITPRLRPRGTSLAVELATGFARELARTKERCRVIDSGPGPRPREIPLVPIRSRPDSPMPVASRVRSACRTWGSPGDWRPIEIPLAEVRAPRS